MEKHLFVYGTLRKGLSDTPHPFLVETAHYVGEAKFNGILFDLGAYPGAIPSGNPHDFVKGEVYALLRPHETLLLLDAYEGCDGCDGDDPLYRREVAALLGDNQTWKAWIYLYNGNVGGCKVIESGDYLEYVKSID
jgi:gamma-glutamylcyclotransferase (GGCT)/AIG2-like uncharacterized protein YtfP